MQVIFLHSLYTQVYFIERKKKTQKKKKKKKMVSPRPGIEPGPSTWQAEILTTRLSRIVRSMSRWKPRNWRKVGFAFFSQFPPIFLARHIHIRDGWGGRRKKSLEPDLNQRPMDSCYLEPTTVHRSTNWAIEGPLATISSFLMLILWIT